MDRARAQGREALRAPCQSATKRRAKLSASSTSSCRRKSAGGSRRRSSTPSSATRARKRRRRTSWPNRRRGSRRRRSRCARRTATSPFCAKPPRYPRALRSGSVPRLRHARRRARRADRFDGAQGHERASRHAERERDKARARRDVLEKTIRDVAKLAVEEKERAGRSRDGARDRSSRLARASGRRIGPRPGRARGG